MRRHCRHCRSAAGCSGCRPGLPPRRCRTTELHSDSDGSWRRSAGTGRAPNAPVLHADLSAGLLLHDEAQSRLPRLRHALQLHGLLQCDIRLGWNRWSRLRRSGRHQDARRGGLNILDSLRQNVAKAARPMVDLARIEWSAMLIMPRRRGGCGWSWMHHVGHSANVTAWRFPLVNVALRVPDGRPLLRTFRLLPGFDP